MSRTSSLFSRPRSGLLGMMALLAACSDDPLPPQPPAPVASVQVAPDTATLLVTETRQLSATAKAADGQLLSDRPITWSSSDTTVVTVSASGVVQARSGGITAIAATSEGRSGTAMVRVNNPAPALGGLSPESGVAGSGTTTLTVSGQGFMPGARVLWEGTALPTTRVSATELRTEVGAAALAEEGSARITVENPAPGGGASAERTFTISPMPVAAITFSPATLSLGVGEEATLGVALQGADGRTLSGRVVAWVSNDPRIAEVDANGRVTGRAEGTVNILAVSEGRSASASVEVELRPAADLVFSSGGQLSILDLRTRGAQPVHVSTGAIQANWMSSPSPAPGGNRIAFAAETNDPATPEVRQSIYAVDRDGANLRRLTSLPGRSDDPAWSPVGPNRIAFRHYSSETHRSDIWVMDADGTNPRNLTSHLPQAGGFSPAWSPDGQWIAFSQSGAGALGSIWIIRADGSEAREVTSQLNGQDATPSWSPDGQWIAFTRSYQNDTDITVVPVNGGGAVRIPLPDHQVGAAWSPDGHFIAFAQYRAGATQMAVYTMRPNGTDVRLRASSGFFPAWIRRP